MISLQESMSVIRKYAPNFSAKTGLILGSGLGMVADELTHTITIPYQAIPGVGASDVPGHPSLLICGCLHDVPVVCLKGRFHFYEGKGYESLARLIHITHQLGVSQLIVTGAAGSFDSAILPGEIVLLTDHINFQPMNPLVGLKDESLGSRFVDMEEAYDSELRDRFVKTAGRLNIRLHQGIYLSLSGPSFETPAEIRAYRLLGATAVGMSVAPEVIIARHCRLRVAGLAAITNLASGLGTEKITHEKSLYYGEITARKLIKLIAQFLKNEIH